MIPNPKRLTSPVALFIAFVISFGAFMQPTSALSATTATPPGAYVWHTWPTPPKYDAQREGYFNFDSTLTVLQDPGLTTYF